MKRRRYDILPEHFYDREPALVAEELLGKLLLRKTDGQRMIARIVETEAYLPFGDPASHSFRGRTKRNESMFKEAGHAYVYRMRQYCLLNVVTEGKDVPGGVLIRAVEPVEGFETMESRSSTNGPGKLCRAMHITHALDGIPVTSTHGELCIAQDPEAPPYITVTTTRIGISSGKDMLLRFYIRENSHVSRKEKRMKK